MYAAMENDRFDLAVVGAGPNGSLLALAAGEAGLSTALIDRMPLQAMTEPAFDGRTTAIAYASQRLFAALGVWDELADKAEPILDIRISDTGHDGRTSPFFLHFDHREAAAEGERAPPMGWIVENRHLRAALLRRLGACKSVEPIAPDETRTTPWSSARAASDCRPTSSRSTSVRHATVAERGWADSSAISFDSDGKRWTCDVQGKGCTSTDRPATVPNSELSPDGRYAAYEDERIALEFSLTGERVRRGDFTHRSHHRCNGGVGPEARELPVADGLEAKADLR